MQVKHVVMVVSGLLVFLLLQPTAQFFGMMFIIKLATGLGLI